MHQDNCTRERIKDGGNVNIGWFCSASSCFCCFQVLPLFEPNSKFPSDFPSFRNNFSFSERFQPVRRRINTLTVCPVTPMSLLHFETSKFCVEGGTFRRHFKSTSWTALLSWSFLSITVTNVRPIQSFVAEERGLSFFQTQSERARWAVHIQILDIRPVFCCQISLFFLEIDIWVRNLPVWASPARKDWRTWNLLNLLLLFSSGQHLQLQKDRRISP